VTVRDKALNVVAAIPAELLFALIGATPHTEWLDAVRAPWQKTMSTRRREILLPEGISPQQARPICSETRATLVASIARGRHWLEELIADATVTPGSMQSSWTASPWATRAQQIAPGASTPAPCWCANIRASGTPSLLCRTASSGATARTGLSPPSRGPLRGRSDQRTGSIKCSYCVPGHMTYGLVGSAFASRG
jgi:hypothetical protein